MAAFKTAGKRAASQAVVGGCWGCLGVLLCARGRTCARARRQRPGAEGGARGAGVSHSITAAQQPVLIPPQARQGGPCCLRATKTRAAGAWRRAASLFRRERPALESASTNYTRLDDSLACLRNSALRQAAMRALRTRPERASALRPPSARRTSRRSSLPPGCLLMQGAS